jgi:excisionase family DNA binding protein
VITLDEARTRPTLTVTEAAALARVGLRQMYEAVHRGEVPVVRLGRRILVKTTPFLAHLGSESDPPPDVAPGPQPLTIDHLIGVLQKLRTQAHPPGTPLDPRNAEEPAWQGELSTTTAAVTKPSQTSTPSVGPGAAPSHASGARTGVAS